MWNEVVGDGILLHIVRNDARNRLCNKAISINADAGMRVKYGKKLSS